MKIGTITTTITLRTDQAIRRHAWRARMRTFYGQDVADELEARADELARTTAMTLEDTEWAAEREKLGELERAIRQLAQETR